MRKITACLLTFMIGGYSVVFAGQVAVEPYQPECEAWNGIAESLSGRDVDCYVLEDCTGIYCNFTFEGNPVEVDIKLFPCEDLPQLRIMLTDRKGSHSVTATHGGPQTLAGVNLNIFGMNVTLIQLDIEFKKESDRVEFGLCLEVFVFITIRLCLFQHSVIPTAPCGTPEQLVCQAMEELATSVTPPTSCSMMATCDGISCVQRYPFSYGIPSTTFFVDVNTDLIVDSCGEVSMILTARSKQLNLDWTRTFTRSDSISVDQDLTFGVTLFVAVTMEYMPDLEHILTTIEYTMTQVGGVTTTEYILQNAEVCIPDCKSESPTREPTAVIPSSDIDECASWENIENALEFSLEGGYSISDCVTLPGCRGFECSAMYLWEMYQVTIEEFHCQDPTYITVSIISAREQYSQTFTHNETVPIPFAEDIKISVHLVKVSPSMIFVGVTILFPFHSTFVEVPLVSDQLLRVTPCIDLTTTMENSRDVTTTMENSRGDDGKSTLDSQSLIFGSIAVVAIVFVVILFIALTIYIRRRKQYKEPETESDGIYEQTMPVSLPA